MSYADKQFNCRDCGQEFVWTAGEQEFFASRGLIHPPSRCPACRRLRKTGGSAAGGGGERAPRTLYPAVCDACGKETSVPFQPTPGKPLYCSECFEQVRANRGAPLPRRSGADG